MLLLYGLGDSGQPGEGIGRVAAERRHCHHPGQVQ
jgi:hypothetical protein